MSDVQNPYLVLGLDPGISSCGFCLIDTNNHEILEMGSHLFHAPQEDKTKVSLAVGRRNARSARRNNQRTKDRLKHCLNLLKSYELAPADADKQWIQSKKGDRPLLELRAAGLDRLLTPRELSQVLYALCSRRGYIPHGEGRQGETDDAEGRKVLSAIKENTRLMSDGGYRTVGEMLCQQGSYRNKGGNYTHCVLNSQIVDEARTLIRAQRSLGLTNIDDEFESRFIDCLTWEKKSLDHDEKVYSLVGKCTYFPNEKRAANADISSELCRAYERLGHLVMVTSDGRERRLTPKQRNHYIDVLFSPVALPRNKDCKVRYSDIRRELDLDSRITFKGINADRESEDVFAPKAWRKLRSIGISPFLLQKMLEDRSFGDAVCEALTYASSEDSLIQRLESLNLSEDELDEILSVPFSSKLFSGYGNRSLKALNLLLDSFEDDAVMTLDDAEKNSGLQQHRLSDHNARHELLPPYISYDETCNNPVVLRSMARMRKIVNAIIKIHGVPNEIHVELGRELKQSKKEKEAIEKRQRQNQKDNKRFAETAAGILGIDASEVPGKVIRKLSMWEEQGEKDLYTGNCIELERLVRDDRYCEIDHILPYSRTCDDSRANKALVLSKSNQDKRNRTPYEWMTSGEIDAPDWNEYSHRIVATVRGWKKRNNLLNTDLPMGLADGFIDRNLNDDRYMSRAVKNYLEDTLLFPDDGQKNHVVAVAGGATANLRWVWGLNFGEGNTKDRDDERHHAVDAAVIAACSRSTVKKVADARSEGRERFKKHRESRLADTQPWPTFAAEVAARREFVVPTRMVDHGVTGRAFEETLYHVDGIRDGKGHYVMIHAGKSTEPKAQGNVRFFSADSVRLIDGIAFLRLWLDPTARPNGKIKGMWYAEPVYHADIPDIQAGTYIPRACSIEVARIAWSPVPETAMQAKPLVLFAGDVLVVDGKVARFSTIKINNRRLIFKHVLCGDDIKDFPSLGSWGKDTEVHVLHEDILGHCYDNFALNRGNSSYIFRNSN